MVWSENSYIIWTNDGLFTAALRTIYRGYPGKMALSAMRKHGG